MKDVATNEVIPSSAYKKMIQQKVGYIHENYLEADFVNKAMEWRLSSASEESPVKLDGCESWVVTRAYKTASPR